MEKRAISLWILFLINFIANASYAIAMPLFPPLASRKGLSDSIIGYIYSLFPVGCIGTTVVLGESFSVKKSKMMMMFGLGSNAIIMFASALIEYIDDQLIFIIVSSILRTVSGIASGCCFAPSYSLAGYLYSEKFNVVMSQMEILAGLGIFTGPLIGGVFDWIGEQTPFGGYKLPYYILSLIYILVMLTTVKFLSIDKKSQEDVLSVFHHPDEASHDDSTQPNPRHQRSEIRHTAKSNKSIFKSGIEKLGYFKVLRIPGVVITALAFGSVYLNAFAIRTYYVKIALKNKAIHLQDYYGLTTVQSTCVFMVNTFTYIIGALIVGRLKNVNLKIVFAANVFMAAVAYLGYGPDPTLTQMGDKLWFSIFCNGLYGFSSAVLYLIVQTPQVLSAHGRVHPNNEQDANDMSTFLYTIGWSFGEFAGPTIGGLLVEKYGFNRAGGILGIEQLFFFFLYFFYMVSDLLKGKRTSMVSEEKLID